MSCPAASILEDIKLNAHGILRLQENQSWEAIHCFSEGLRSVVFSLQRAANDADADNEPSSSSHEQDDDDSSQSDLPPRLQNMLVSIDLSQCNGLYADSDSDYRFAIYNQALHLSLGSSVDSWPRSKIPETYCHLLCGVFLYNIGLAHHIMALADGDTASLTKALDFYSIAHRTIPTEDPPPLPSTPARGDGGDDDEEQAPSQQLANLAFLALANNVGQIHALCFNFAKARVCSEEIFQRLAFLLIRSPETAKQNLLAFERQSEYRLFMLNASLFTAIDRMPAPAA